MPYSNNRSPYTRGNTPPKGTPRLSLGAGPPTGLKVAPPSAQVSPPPQLVPPQSYKFQPTSPISSGVPAAGAGAAGAVGATTFGLALLLAIPQLLLFDSPAAAPELPTFPTKPELPESPAAAPELLNPPESVYIEPPIVPFRGGQSCDVSYRIDVVLKAGPIVSPGVLRSRKGTILGIRARKSGASTIFSMHYRSCAGVETQEDIASTGESNPTMEITSISREDGLPDTGGNPPPTNTPTFSQSPPPLRAPDPQPPTSAPSPAPGQPQADPLSDLQLLSPAPAPTPQLIPNLQLQPKPIGQPQPITPDQYQPLPFSDPFPLIGVGLAPDSIASPVPDLLPLLNPDNLPIPPAILVQPGDNPGPLVFTPSPGTGNPQPAPTPIIAPPRSPNPEPTDLERIRDEINKVLTPVAITIAGITALLNPVGGKLDIIKDQTSPNALKNAAQAATCEAAQPGGCSYEMTNDAVKKGNEQINNKLLDIGNLLSNLGELALLKPIYETVTKTSEGLGKFYKWAHLDRVTNLVTTAGVIHNAMMLSTSISDTLFSTLDNIFAIPSLIKDPNGDTIDTKETFTKHLDGFFTSLFGQTEWKAIKAQWKAYSTIYNTGAQVFGNVRDIFDETSQIQEVTRNWVAELGNGLQDEGLIGEDNWEVKDPKKQIKGKYFARLQRIAEGLEQVENVAEDLEQVTSSARNIVETANEIKENATAISTAVSEANKAAKADRDAKEEGLELPNFSLEDLF